MVSPHRQLVVAVVAARRCVPYGNWLGAKILRSFDPAFNRPN
jgi:hypothetical protein